jgi:hypothetical protein
VTYFLGKKPAREGAIKFAFDKYFDVPSLPKPPKRFLSNKLPPNWKMFANDQCGDCVWAGAAHEHMKWGFEAGQLITFTDEDVLADYSACTGYDPANPDTDQGTDLQAALSYRRKTGIMDEIGIRRTIDSYVALAPGDPDQVALAAYLMGACSVGVILRQNNVDQFDALLPWAPDDSSPIIGGHYVPCIGRNSANNLVVVTWGRLHAMTPKFVQAQMDEGAACLDFDRLTKGFSPQLFDIATLKADLAALANPGA